MKSAVLAVVLLFLFVPATVQAQELRKENRHFVITYALGDEKIAAALERESLPIRKRIIADVGIDFADKTEIRIAPTLKDFRENQPDGNWVPAWAVGVAYPDKNIIVLRSPRAVKGRSDDMIKVFAHEFSHIALGRALKGVRVPRWLDEGLAIYEAREWNFSRITVLTRAALTDRLIPLSVLTSSFPADERSAELAYAESFMFVSFLINKIGRENFHRIIKDYARYGDLKGAFRRGAGMTIPELEDQWLIYLKLRVSWIPLLTSVTAVWFIMALIFIYGYLRKRKQMQRRLAEMADQEEEEQPSG